MQAHAADDLVREHYRGEATNHQLAPTSTMADLVTREAEIDAVLACLAHALGDRSEAQVLEVGCGNGHLLAELRSRFPGIALHGIDFSPEMIELARSRGLDRCEADEGDVRRLRFADATFDAVVSERCLINLLADDEQEQALRELARVLRPGGRVVLVEAFTDGWANLNRARAELGLEPNSQPFHNRWMDKDRVLGVLGELFEPIGDDTAGLPPMNFLSSHYFISRVLYPAVTSREIVYNSEFVKFFRFLPPSGDYSPIQLLHLRRRGDAAMRSR